MGYYGEDGRWHTSAAQPFHALAEKISHHGHGHNEHIDVNIRENITITGNGAPAVHTRPISNNSPLLPNTCTVPCQNIRLGDWLVIQGRPCQVIRISTSSATGQYRYLGVDLFTKQLHEESSMISNPAPNVVFQTMAAPVFKQYRVLDLGDGHVTAMTETGDVKQGIPCIDQSNLWPRLKGAFETGRGSVRVLVLNDGGRELAVDMKVLHGARL